jgi:zinc transport system substrate-binding protein
MRKVLLIILLILLLAGVVLLIKSSQSLAPAKSGKILVTTSFYPLYFFASQIGGSKADVINITPAGAEPHDYEPTTQQIAKISQSNLLILNGGNLEAWGGKIGDILAGNNVLILTVGNNLVNRQTTENGKKILDPHIWLDPVLAKYEEERILEGFRKIDPANAAYYQANADKLTTGLDQLDNEFKTGLANCQKKDFITSHAAFGYLASRNNLIFWPNQETSPCEGWISPNMSFNSVDLPPPFGPKIPR